MISFLKEFNITEAGTPYVLAKTLKEEFPMVEKATTIRPLRSFKIKQDENYINIRSALATDSDVFDIFTVPIIGSRLYDNPLKDLNSIVLSAKLATQLFHDVDPVGEELEILISNTEQVFVVSAVFKDFSRNSTFSPDCMVNCQWTLAPLNETFRTNDMDRTWRFNFWGTWILLSKEGDASELEDQFEAFERKFINDDPHVHFSLQNLSDVYLRSQDIANTGPAGNLKNIRLFSGIAFLIVLIAAINYIILSVAVSTGRAKEIGIRKTAGASVRRIRNQVQSEAVILTLLVLPLAVLFMWLGKPYGEKLFRASLEIIPGNLATYISTYLLLTILIGIASGFYASSYLSRLKVMDVLKQKVNIGKRRKVFRSALIVIQLMIFCSFVSATLIIGLQYQFALNMDPGHYKKDILQIELGRGFSNYNAFLNAIKSVPEVINAAGTYEGLPMNNQMFSMHSHFRNREVKVKVEGYAIDFDLLETMGIKLLEGRTFSREYGGDLSHSRILNETAVRELGIENPIGHMVDSTHEIIGVVKDFNLHSIHTKITPLEIELTDMYLYHIIIHYQSGTLEELVPKLRREWEEVEPEKAFAYSTIEEIFEDTYTTEKNLSTIFSIAALFALLIATFGLFGLTLFVARSRANEIGIRKVFGSPEGAIVNSFLKGNFILVLLAELLSIPITVYFLNKWLNNFPYRTRIEWWVFAFAFVIATVVVLATVYIHSRKVSRVNPIEALRYE